MLLNFPLVNYDKYGDDEIDRDQHLNIVMNINGTTENYSIDVVEKEVIRSIKNVIKESLRAEDKDELEIELDLDNEEDLIELD